MWRSRSGRCRARSRCSQQFPGKGSLRRPRRGLGVPLLKRRRYGSGNLAWPDQRRVQRRRLRSLACRRRRRRRPASRQRDTNGFPTFPVPHATPRWSPLRAQLWECRAQRVTVAANRPPQGPVVSRLLRQRRARQDAPRRRPRAAADRQPLEGSPQSFQSAAPTSPRAELRPCTSFLRRQQGGRRRPLPLPCLWPVMSSLRQQSSWLALLPLQMRVRGPDRPLPHGHLMLKNLARSPA